jgi:hypothetical protein
MNQEVAGFCPACGGAGFVVVPLEYADVETGSWCPHCGGRLLFESSRYCNASLGSCPSRLLQRRRFGATTEAHRFAKSAS